MQCDDLAVCNYFPQRSSTQSWHISGALSIAIGEARSSFVDGDFIFNRGARRRIGIWAFHPCGNALKAGTGRRSLCFRHRCDNTAAEHCTQKGQAASEIIVNRFTRSKNPGISTNLVASSNCTRIYKLKVICLCLSMSYSKINSCGKCAYELLLHKAEHIYEKHSSDHLIYFLLQEQQPSP